MCARHHRCRCCPDHVLDSETNSCELPCDKLTLITFDTNPTHYPKALVAPILEFREVLVAGRAQRTHLRPSFIPKPST